MSFARNSSPFLSSAFGPRLMWTEIPPTTASTSAVFVHRSPSATFCVRAGTHMSVFFHAIAPASLSLRGLPGSPTISTSGLSSFDFSLPGAEFPAWLDVASSHFSVAG